MAVGESYEVYLDKPLGLRCVPHACPSPPPGKHLGVKYIPAPSSPPACRQASHTGTLSGSVLEGVWRSLSVPFARPTSHTVSKLVLDWAAPKDYTLVGDGDSEALGLATLSQVRPRQ